MLVQKVLRIGRAWCGNCSHTLRESFYAIQGLPTSIQCKIQEMTGQICFFVFLHYFRYFLSSGAIYYDPMVLGIVQEGRSRIRRGGWTRD